MISRIISLMLQFGEQANLIRNKTKHGYDLVF